jgi:hypothetical protein
MLGVQDACAFAHVACPFPCALAAFTVGAPAVAVFAFDSSVAFACGTVFHGDCVGDWVECVIGECMKEGTVDIRTERTCTDLISRMGWRRWTEDAEYDDEF